MIIQVLCILTATSLFSYTSCDNDAKSETGSISWKLPLSRETTVTKIGKQMPPHHEPDAILVNTHGSGQPQIPEGNFPGYPGGPTIFGFPRPGVNMPGGFGVPGIFGTPRLPAHPFGIPGSPVFPNQHGMQGVPGVPNDPGVFMIPGQGGPPMHNTPNVYSVQAAQNGPGFIVRTGYFGLNGENLQPGDPRIFGPPRVFATAGSGNVPFSALPEFFLPGRHSNVPHAAGNFPSLRRTIPETFEPNPGKTNGFRPRTIPNRPDYNSDGNFPRHEFYGGTGGREVYDDPIANPFPVKEASPLFFEVPS